MLTSGQRNGVNSIKQGSIMKIQELSSKITFKNNHTDHVSGQDDYLLQGIVDGEVIGDISYSVFEDKVYVNMIEVHSKRNGYGKELLRYLQGLFPETEINFGILTTEGNALIDSLEFSKSPSMYYEKFKELEILRGQLDAALETEDFQYMNDIRDKIDDLEDELYDNSPYIKIIK